MDGNTIRSYCLSVCKEASRLGCRIHVSDWYYVMSFPNGRKISVNVTGISSKRVRLWLLCKKFHKEVLAR